MLTVVGDRVEEALAANPRAVRVALALAAFAAGEEAVPEDRDQLRSCTPAEASIVTVSRGMGDLQAAVLTASARWIPRRGRAGEAPRSSARS